MEKNRDTMARLEILPGRQMRWSKNRDKIGTRNVRHRIGRFVLKVCKDDLPVRVKVAKFDKTRKFCFVPVLVNGLSKKVLLSYKKFIVCMNFEDTDTRIQTFISSNRLYEQERFRYFL